MARKDSKILKSCNCSPECNEIKYDYNVVKSDFVDENITGGIFSTAASIYFGDDEFTAYKRFESYGTVQLLSNIGGYLGLFLGLSVLSVVEFVYFFTLRFVNDLWHTPSSL